MYLAIGIIEHPNGDTTYEAVKYFYAFPDEPTAEAFVQQVYRMRTASRWEVVPVKVETSASAAAHLHIEEAKDESNG